MHDVSQGVLGRVQANNADSTVFSVHTTCLIQKRDCQQLLRLVVWVNEFCTSVTIKFSNRLVTSIVYRLQRWSVYTEKLQPVQQRNMAHFGFVNKDLFVSSFALTKIVICIRKLLLLFVKVVVYIPSVLRIRNWLNYGWSKTKWSRVTGVHSSSVQSEKISASFGSGETFMSPLDLCANTVWCAVNVKSRKMAQIKTDCFTAAQRKMLVVSSSGSNKGLVQLKPALRSSATRFNTDTRLKKQERHLLVLKLTLRMLMKNIYF